MNVSAEYHEIASCAFGALAMTGKRHVIARSGSPESQFGMDSRIGQPGGAAQQGEGQGSPELI